MEGILEILGVETIAHIRLCVRTLMGMPGASQNIEALFRKRTRNFSHSTQSQKRPTSLRLLLLFRSFLMLPLLSAKSQSPNPKPKITKT